MAVDAFNAAKCRVVEAEVISFDGNKKRKITDLITAFSIVQSIEMTSYRGSIRIQDNVGLLSGFPLRGEERLLMELEPGNQTGNVILELQIHRIDNVVTSETNDGVNFTAHFVSYTTYAASRRKIIKSYPRDSVNQVVTKIFENYFAPITFQNVTLPGATRRYRINDRQFLYVQPTLGLSDWIIPNYTPQEAMYFLATRAFSDYDATSSFRFFETLDAYYFVTDEVLIRRAVNSDLFDNKPVKKLIYNPVTSKDPRNTNDQIFNIETLQNQKRVDSAEDMYSGGYYSRVNEFDLLRRRLTAIEFNYREDAGTRVKWLDTTGELISGSTVHTNLFMEQTFTQENARVFNLYRDYTRNGDNPSELNAEKYLAEIVTRRVAFQHHLNNTAVMASMKGRIDIKPGEMVNIDMQDFTPADKKSSNPQLSGNYLVHTVNLEMEHEILNTVLKLVKYDWSV